MSSNRGRLLSASASLFIKEPTRRRGRATGNRRDPDEQIKLTDKKTSIFPIQSIPIRMRTVAVAAATRLQIGFWLVAWSWPTRRVEYASLLAAALQPRI
jgi:hypothetical protein